MRAYEKAEVVMWVIYEGQEKGGNVILLCISNMIHW